MTWCSRPAVIARSLLAGLCIAASVPPWGWWPLAFVGIAMWDRLLADRPWRSRFGCSWIVGAAWLYPATIWMWDLTAPGYVVAGAVFASFFGLAGAVTPPHAPARWIAFPAAIVLAEAARWTVPFGGIPLATLAMSQAGSPLAQTARLGTAVLVSGLVAVTGVALSVAWQRRFRPAIVTVAVVTVAILVALVAPRGHDVAPLSFAVVQGGGPQRTRAATTDAREVFDRHLEASNRIHTPVDLVLWPENVVAVDGSLVDSPENSELAALARRLDATLIVGATEDDGPDHFLNAAVVYNPDGSTGERYDKVRRVPFGEYVPLRALIERVAGADSGLPQRDAVPGTAPAILRTPTGDFAVAISWEIFFTNRARAGVLHGGEVLLNPTNGSSYWLTQVQSQQVASSRLRSIETGRWTLQAAPTGFSAVVSPTGDVTVRTGTEEQRVIEGTVQRRSGDTIATIVGPLPTVWLAGILVGVGWVIDRRRRDPRSNAEQRDSTEPRHGPDRRDSSERRVSGDGEHVVAASGRPEHDNEGDGPSA